MENNYVSVTMGILDLGNVFDLLWLLFVPETASYVLSECSIPFILVAFLTLKID